MDCSSNKSGIARNFLEQSTCGKRNKNLQEIIGGHAIKHGKAFRTHLENRHGNSEPCNKMCHLYDQAMMQVGHWH